MPLLRLSELSDLAVASVLTLAEPDNPGVARSGDPLLRLAAKLRELLADAELGLALAKALGYDDRQFGRLKGDAELSTFYALTADFCELVGIQVEHWHDLPGARPTERVRLAAIDLCGDIVQWVRRPW